ncbi:DUF4389 domain-containing protein, partial [Chloroflexota bacterium]
MSLQQPREAPYPLYFKGELVEPLSPLLPQVKLLALAPHYVVLCFLWLGFALAWLVSLFAVVLTGKYPRRLFDFNLGVLRWSWRVAFYGYGALGTDRYPPFTLKSVDYPADLDAPYPERLSLSLALVKWWLLILPHYVILYVVVRYGLFFFCTVFVALALYFTLKYPKGLFDFLLGLNRWTYRIAAYVALMTDRYPPFRLGERTTTEGPTTGPQVDVLFEDTSDAEDRVQAQAEKGPRWSWGAFAVPELWFIYYDALSVGVTSFILDCLSLALVGLLVGAWGLPGLAPGLVSFLAVRTWYGMVGNRVYYARYGRWKSLNRGQADQTAEEATTWYPSTP